MDDTLADRILTDSERNAWLDRFQQMLTAEQRAAVAALSDPRSALDLAVRQSPAYGGVIVRQRYAEDRLQVALHAGVEQYVILGAGMDSFALRTAGRHTGLQIFEVDQAPTQDLKRQRLRDAGIILPAQLRFVAADLTQPDLPERLEAAGLAINRPAFFSLLGVTQYLNHDQNLALLRSLASLAAAGSELVFDYLEPAALSPLQADSGVQRVAAERAASSEPWALGLSPDSLARDLDSCQWKQWADLDWRTLQRRYCTGRSDGLSVSAHLHVVAARRSE